MWGQPLDLRIQIRRSACLSYKTSRGNPHDLRNCLKNPIGEVQVAASLLKANLIQADL